MQLTSAQRKEIVKHNTNLAKQVIAEVKNVINKAERANKGIYVHGINANVHQMKELLKNKSLLTLDSPEFEELCKLRQQVSADLFLLEKGIK